VDDIGNDGSDDNYDDINDNEGDDVKYWQQRCESRWLEVINSIITTQRQEYKWWKSGEE
jgi:hypothetical protein